ncbi:Lrp/AsnC family transcriptional regulator [Haladaptatus salinisoli]|uniref:Lrp/AsnC family transcriptional regulator n=1 Tax=Haladaptatus salinisoli TaxID=2884876 RepID=UPI001D0A6815|nr:AsnC family transcriptional regulator [Haladaptatus salinisoli]
MGKRELDSVDKGILYLLQRDARNHTTKEMGERVGVAASTVASRIKKLERSGVIVGYRPRIDYERAGYDSHLIVVGTVPTERRDSIIDELAEVSGIVNIRTVLTDEENVSIEIVGATQSEVEERVEALNDRGVSVVRTDLLREEHERPFDHFGTGLADDGDEFA